MLRWRYNIDEVEYNRILELQGERCALCEATDKLHVDHDHSCCPGDRSCGECIRAIICARHNMILGLVRDNADEFEGLAQYLDRGPDKTIRKTDTPSLPKQPAKPKPPTKPRLTVKQIYAIREVSASMRETAAAFGVSVGTVHAIKNNQVPYDDLSLTFREAAELRKSRKV